MQLEGRHLRVVCAIAEFGSLTKAAAALGMSQPALTRQVQRMERALGGPLFSRDGAGSTPTALGNYVLSRARAVLPALDELIAEADSLAAGRGSLDRIRFGSALGPLAAGLVPHLRMLTPTASINLRTEHSNAVLAELVASKRLELAALGEYPGYQTPLKPDLEKQVIATEPVFVLLSDTHPFAPHEEIGLADLASADWALEPPGDNRFREYFTAACHGVGFTPSVRYEVDDDSSVDLLLSGQALSLGHATWKPVPGIAMRPLVGTPLWETHLLIWHRHGPLADLHDEVAKAATDVYHAAVLRTPVYLAWLARHPEYQLP